MLTALAIFLPKLLLLLLAKAKLDMGTGCWKSTRRAGMDYLSSQYERTLMSACEWCAKCCSEMCSLCCQNADDERKRLKLLQLCPTQQLSCFLSVDIEQTVALCGQIGNRTRADIDGSASLVASRDCLKVWGIFFQICDALHHMHRPSVQKFGVQKFGALVAFSTVWGSSDESLARAGRHEFRAHFQNPMLGIRVGWRAFAELQSRSLVASVSVRSRQSLGEKPTGGVASIFCNR